MHARIQIYWCRGFIFRHLKLELQFPSSNDEKYINVVYIWRKFVSFYGYVHWRMTTEISVMYGSDKVNIRSHISPSQLKLLNDNYCSEHLGCHDQQSLLMNWISIFSWKFDLFHLQTWYWYTADTQRQRVPNLNNPIKQVRWNEMNRALGHLCAHIG